MIRSKKLYNHKKITHGFFNRVGGKSKGIYKSLNCGHGSKDKETYVKQNLKIVKEKISKDAKKILLPYQSHSNKFIYIGKNFRNYRKKFKADALITDQKKLPIAILTADCAPLLIYDNEKNMIAAIHAGWKGAFKGIVHRVIRFMLKKGCKKKSMTIAVGPCIAQKNYNVKIDFMRKFVKKSLKNKIFFKTRKKTIYFNLKNYIKSQIRTHKISKIDTLNIDTFDNKNKFFSARRSLKLKHDDYGRNISIIMIN